MKTGGENGGTVLFHLPPVFLHCHGDMVNDIIPKRYK